MDISDIFSKDPKSTGRLAPHEFNDLGTAITLMSIYMSGEIGFVTAYRRMPEPINEAFYQAVMDGPESEHWLIDRLIEMRNIAEDQFPTDLY